LSKEKEGEENKAGPEQNLSVGRENVSPQVKIVDCLLKIGALSADPSFSDALQAAY
jgi:hypothetical protein